jgi:hypothetical protein
MALTANKNFLSPVGFTLKIDSGMANTEYFCTQANIPGISLPNVDTPYKGVNLGMTGDRLTFDDLTITFNITENMENYIEMWNWMHNIISKKDAEKNYKFDARLMILSSHNNVVKEIKFQDIFPTNLGSIEFNSQLTDIEYAQATVTFKYTYYEIE